MPVESQEASKKKQTIAIVEDDAGLAGLFRDALGLNSSFELHLFSDGQEAKRSLPTLGANLILLDVGLPNLDGVSLFKILRGHSNTKNTPIIIITGSQDWELHRMGLQTGLLLRKPFTVQDLLFMIRALLPEEGSKR